MASEVPELSIVPALEDTGVRRQAEKLKDKLKFIQLFQTLHIVGKCLYVANLAMASEARFLTKVQNSLFKVLKLCDASSLMLQNFQSGAGNILEKLKIGYLYLLDGFEDFARTDIKATERDVDSMKESVGKTCTAMESCQTEVKEVNHGIRSRLEEMKNKNQVTDLPDQSKTSERHDRANAKIGPRQRQGIDMPDVAADESFPDPTTPLLPKTSGHHDREEPRTQFSGRVMRFLLFFSVFSTLLSLYTVGYHYVPEDEDNLSLLVDLMMVFDVIPFVIVIGYWMYQCCTRKRCVNPSTWPPHIKGYVGLSCGSLIMTLIAVLTSRSLFLLYLDLTFLSASFAVLLHYSCNYKTINQARMENYQSSGDLERAAPTVEPKVAQDYSDGKDMMLFDLTVASLQDAASNLSVAVHLVSDLVPIVEDWLRECQEILEPTMDQGIRQSEKLPPEEKTAYWNSIVFREEVHRYYCRWVALQVCAMETRGKSKGIRKTVEDYYTDNPLPTEAKEKAVRIAAKETLPNIEAVMKMYPHHP